MTGAENVETVTCRWIHGSGWSYVHRDMHGNVIETSTDAYAKVTTARFPTPADEQSLVHEASQVWPSARIIVSTDTA